MDANYNTYDVVIIGAGAAGCATAIALKNEAPYLNILIIERTSKINSKDKNVLRIGETLPPQISKQFQNLGIWSSFLSCNFTPSYGTSSAWGSSELYHNEYIYSPFGYGWHLDRVKFDEFMIKEAQERGVDFYFNCTISSIKKEKTDWLLQCNSKNKYLDVRARFFIDATGKKASFSSRFFSKKIKEDQLVGIYQFYTSTNKSKNSLGIGSCVETDPYGWWYSATLPNNKIVVGYMTDADIANELHLRKKSIFESTLNTTKHTATRVKDHTGIEQPIVVAAHTQHLSSVSGKAWLAVGDAASSYDPISSLGIFKSITMSMYASYTVLDFLKGDSSGLKKYQSIIDRDYRAYKKKKQEYYTQEKRFKEYPFWKRRQYSLIKETIISN